MKRYLLALVACAVGEIAYCQGIVAPSPDAINLAKGSLNQVNLYTGSLAIGIPLTQVVGRELSVPISLHHSAQGNRVADLAGVVGLNWSISAGGVITRITQGRPDELTDGFCKPNRIDKEPDIFYFNILGRSGKFILDTYGNPVIVPYQNIIIRPGICKTSTNVWEVVDEAGTTYVFGKTILDRETTTTRLVGASSDQYSYVSAWYLSEIKSANQTENITFSYLNTSYSYTNYYFAKQDGCTTDTNIKDESTQVTVNARYLSGIYSVGGSAVFEYRGGREDLNGGFYLTGVRVTNNQGQLVSKHSFEYGYFQASDCNTMLCKRLKLEKIFDLAPDALYRFTYNTEVNLPARNSKNFDNWGFYNANTVDSWIPDVSLSVAPYYLPGASRTADPQRMQANIIQRIDYRSGGYETYEFESHWVWHSGVHHTVSGLRIKKIKIGDGAGNEYPREYKYVKFSNPIESSGLLFLKPLSHMSYGSTGNGTYTVKRFSHAYSQILDLNGTHVGYSNVEEVIPNQGRNAYVFTNYDTRPDHLNGSPVDTQSPPFSPTTSYAWERGNTISLSVYNQANQLVTKELNDYTFNHANKRSVACKRTVTLSYNCGGSQSTTAVSGEYLVVSRPFTLAKKTVELFQLTDATKKTSSVTAYKYDPNTFQLIKTSRYNPLDTTIQYHNETRFVTNSSYAFTPQLEVNCEQQYQNCMASCDAEPDQQVRNACYNDCATFSGSCVNTPPVNASDDAAIILAFRDRHQTTVPIEVLSTYSDAGVVNILSSTMYKYQTEGTKIHPKEVWSIERVMPESGYIKTSTLSNGSFVSDTRLVKVKSFTQYDPTTGRLLQETGLDGLITSYQWIHNSVAIGSQTVTGALGKERIVSFTHKPMIGNLSSTDVNGLTKTFEYDGYNRLKLMRDHSGNILERIRYHYQNETPGFKIVPDRTEAFVNQNFTFYAQDFAVGSGSSLNLTWDFGDGTVVPNANATLSHSYLSPGLYTVKLTASNDEYPAAVRTKQVGVFSPMNLNVCVDGPIDIDICGTIQPYFGPCTQNNTTQSSPATLTVGILGGCASNYLYTWESRNVNYQTWSPIGGNTPSVNFYLPITPGTYEVKATVTDGCGDVQTFSSFFNIFKSDPGCGGLGEN